jgi:rod shape determining protein RodA
MSTFNPPSFFQKTLQVIQKYLISPMDLPLLGILLCIFTISTVTIYSAAQGSPVDLWVQGRNILIAVTVMWIVAQVPTPFIIKMGPIIYTIGVTLLIMVALFGIVKKGSRRWVNIGVVIQPSEILKIAMPLMLAWYFDKKEQSIQLKEFIFASILLIIPFALILKQPDLGTALLVLASGLYVLYFAGMSWRLLIPIFITLTLGILSIVMLGDHLCQDNVSWSPFLHDYQKHRVCTLLNPNSDPLGKGFHIIQSMIAIGSGGILGKGWLQGTQTHLEFLPEKHTDFIFAVYSEEFGLVGNLILIFLYTLLIIRCFLIAHQAQIFAAKLLASALGLMFFSYAFINMGMVSGILPVVGVPLPFMSYGGTALMTLGLASGILMSISNSRNLTKH